jgi:ATP phosphoribosyltransferase
MKLKIALPKGRMVTKSYSIFKEFGYTSAELDDEIQMRREQNLGTSKLNNNTYEGEKVSFIIPKAGDLAGYVADGVAYMGVLGGDCMTEWTLSNPSNNITASKIDTRFDMPKMKFCIIGKAANLPRFVQSVNDNAPLTLATSFPASAKAFMAKTFPQFRPEFLRVLNLEGEVELGIKTDRADIGYEIVESGNSLVRNNLIEYFPQELSKPIPILLVTNNIARELDKKVGDLALQIGSEI